MNKKTLFCTDLPETVRKTTALRCTVIRLKCYFPNIKILS